jgi:hypothetical protein
MRQRHCPQPRLAALLVVLLADAVSIGPARSSSPDAELRW